MVGFSFDPLWCVFLKPLEAWGGTLVPGIGEAWEEAHLHTLCVLLLADGQPSGLFQEKVWTLSQGHLTAPGLP